MKVCLIVATSTNNVIGLNNQIPWHLPEELSYFKKITMGKPIIMGRRTFDSIKRPLPGRDNIVVTRNDSWTHQGVHSVLSLDDALVRAQNTLSTSDQDEVMVIGGEQIYKQTLKIANKIYLTRIDRIFKGDAFFPEIDTSIWLEDSVQAHQSKTDPSLNYRCIVYLKNNS